MKTLHFETLLTDGGIALLSSYLFFIGVFLIAVRVNLFRRRLDRTLEEQYSWREKKGRPWKFYFAILTLSCVGFCPFLPYVVVTTTFCILTVFFFLWILHWDEGFKHSFFPILAFMLSFYATALNCELTSLLLYGKEWPTHVVSGFGTRIMIHGLSVLFGLVILLWYSMKIKADDSEEEFRLRHVVFCRHEKLIEQLIGERFPKSRKNSSQTD